MSFCCLYGLLRQLAVNSPFRAQTTARFGCASPRAINKARQWPLGQTPGMTKIKDIAESYKESPGAQPGTEPDSNMRGRLKAYRGKGAEGLRHLGTKLSILWFCLFVQPSLEHEVAKE